MKRRKKKQREMMKRNEEQTFKNDLQMASIKGRVRRAGEERGSMDEALKWTEGSDVAIFQKLSHDKSYSGSTKAMLAS